MDITGEIQKTHNVEEWPQRKQSIEWLFCLERIQPVKYIYISTIHSIRSVIKRGTYQRITTQSLGHYGRGCRKRGQPRERNKPYLTRWSRNRTQPRNSLVMESYIQVPSDSHGCHGHRDLQHKLDGTVYSTAACYLNRIVMAMMAITWHMALGFW